MTVPLLQTKLHVPRLRRAVVARPRLSARLSGSWDSTLTLVSAPAGFGKTTLLAEWSARNSVDGRSTAWLSLDPRDNDPATFWTYVLAALRTTSPDLGAPALPPLQSPQSPTQAGLEELLNDVQALARDVVLVLDDYHVIDNREVHDGLAFVLDHLPAQAHVVLATRADPPLQVARLRARGELVEVRAADLRFTPDEAAAYLRDATGLPLTEHDVRALDERTEGWIAALQLAALSVRGRGDVAGFIASFTGDDRYVVDYLAEEVLQRLPEDVRSFLLQTSVLNRLTGPLCDAVTGQDGGRATLQALDRENLFVVALDDRRRWYRYHHLFADVLRARLLDEQPDQVGRLHLRASEWHEAHGELAEAVHHALAGEHLQRAANLTELAIPILRRDRQESTLRRWLEALPAELVRASPALGIGYVGALMAHGELEGVEEHLGAVERWLETAGGADAATGTQAVVAQGPLLRSLPGTIAMYRAGQARLRGDVAGTIAHARRAMEFAGEADHLERGAAAALLGLAHWSTGDVESAARWYADSVGCMRRAGHVPDLLGCTIALADLELARGRLSEAMAAYERALDTAGRQPTVPRGTADMHVGLGRLLIERDELPAAVEHLRASATLGERAALAQNAYRWRVAMAEVRQVEGAASAALALLDEAERVYDTDYSPDVRPIPAVRARLWLAEGRIADAWGWAQARGLSADDEPSYLREYEHLTLARLLLARQRHASGGPRHHLDDFLRRLLAAAEDGGRHGSALEVLVLQALAAHARNDSATALGTLGRAMALAEPQGYARVFVEHGAPMAVLLAAAAKQPTAGDYARRLLAALGDRQDRVPGQRQVVERLSARELEVLRLLASDLDGPDIARSLVVSVNTVRTHTKNIYAKLGVSNRRAAVLRAQDLGLLSRSAHP